MRRLPGAALVLLLVAGERAAQAAEREFAVELTPLLQARPRAPGMGLQLAALYDLDDRLGLGGTLHVGDYGRERTAHAAGLPQAWQHRTTTLGLGLGLHVNPLAPYSALLCGDALLLRLALQVGLAAEQWRHVQHLLGDAWVADAPAAWHPELFAQAQATLGWRWRGGWSTHLLGGWRLSGVAAPADWHLGLGGGFIFY